MIAHDPSYGRARRVALAGVAASAVLAGLNITVGLLTGSVSVVAIGLELTGDVLASSIVLVGLSIAARPADASHPYGHGRVETLSAFVVGVILAVGGVILAYHSLQGVGDPHTAPGRGAMVVLVGTILARAILSTVKFRLGRRLGSSALVADAWNDAVDILSAAGALTAVGLATWDPVRFLAADRYGGFLVGTIVVLTGVRVLRDASLELVDTMPPPEVTDQIESVARVVPGVLGIDKLFARKTGLGYHIELHVEVDPALTVAASHAIAGHVRSTLKERLTWVADVLVHVEPAEGHR